jgi:hypothetical protein
MPKSSIGPDLDEPLDVHLDFSTQISLDDVATLDDVADRANLALRELRVTLVWIHTREVQDVVASLPANAVDIRQPYFDALVPRQVDSCNTNHAI